MTKKGLILTLLFVTCLLGCDNLFQPPNYQAPPVEEGYGKVSVNFADGQSRTVFPAKIFDNYMYTFFTNGSEPLVLSPGTGGLFTLEVGDWQVYVEAYVGGIAPANRAAAGTANFTVNSGATAEVTVALDAVEANGYGTFTYNIHYPANTHIEITLQKLPGLTASVDLSPDNTVTNGNITVIGKTAQNVPAGFYLLTVQIRNGGWYAGISEAVHIYPLLTTEYVTQFSELNLLPTIINSANIKGITPVIGAAPPTAITETEQYSGTVTWNPSHSTFTANTTYTATITLALKNGYILQGVPANFFNATGASSTSSAANSGIITAVFTTLPHSYLKVTNTTEWNSALSIIRNGGNDKSYIIEIDGNVGVGGITSANNNTAGLGTATGITVTLVGSRKLYLTSQGSIIRVGANQTLVINDRDLILEGLNNNTSTVYVSGTNAKLELKNGTISGNTASFSSSYSSGGGVSVSGGGTFTMTGGEISSNTVSGSGSSTNVGGGGVYITGNNSTFAMNGGKISGNTSASASGSSNYSDGGGVYVSSGGTFTMNNGEISGNTASGSGSSTYRSGGGVSVVGSSFTMNGGKISGNTSNRSGGGVYAEGGTFTMNNGEISGNTASSGGGVYVNVTNNSTSNFIMNDGKISGNTAPNGGGVYVTGSNSSFTMSNGEISGNNASGNTAPNGGGVYVDRGNFTLSDGKISGNKAYTTSNISGSSYGGGVYATSNSSFTMTGGEISGNLVAAISSSHGGGVYVSGGTLTIGGTAQIYSNSSQLYSNSSINNDNVYLPNNQYITLGNSVNAPANGMNVYVQTATVGGVIVQSNAATGTEQYFHPDQSGKMVVLQSGGQLAIIDATTGSVGSITVPIWRNGSPVSLVVPPVAVPAGQTITAQGWQISDNGSSGWTNFTPPSTADMSYNGKYLRYYATGSGGQTYYSPNVASIRVITLSQTEREVVIEMWDSYGDGWNFNAALRINKNGTDISPNVRLTNGSGPAYYYFIVNFGDVVRFYWVNGGLGDGECAFAAYYSDDPPNPAFNPTMGTIDTDRVLVSKRYNNSSGTVGNGVLMGSFTASSTITSVTVSPASVSVAKGTTQSFSAVVTGTNSPSQAVTWSIVQTNKHSGTTIDSNGFLTVSASETLTALTVRATSVDTSKYGEATVNLTTVPVTGVSLNKSTASLGVGYAEILAATITPSNATNKNVTWSSSNTAVATVLPSGTVYAVAVGTATITVTTVDGSRTAACTVTVSPVFYTITFNANDGSGTPPSAQTVQAGSSITLPSGSGLTRNGYTFGGWNTDPSGTGTNYGAGSSYTPPFNRTLYARWIVHYTVTFNAFGGSGTPPSAQTVQPGSSITLPSGSGLSKAGSVFGGWISMSGAGGTYSAGASFTPTGNTTFFAKWDTVVTVSGSNLTEKLGWVQSNAQDNYTYIIEVNANESIAPHVLWYNDQRVTITLRGIGANRTISLSSGGSMFTVGSNNVGTGSGITLILDNNITLQGRSNNTNSLVDVVHGGTFIMNSGSIITGNSSSNFFSSGGVNVQGTFVMNGGTIIGNSGDTGGGVFVIGGIFAMNGGTITANTATSMGGGVAVHGGTFNKTGGTIYGHNDANSDNVVRISGAVQSNRGHAVAVYDNIGIIIRKEATAGTGINLYYNSATGEYTGLWDN
jgi:uncharacterized protein YjdB